MKRLKPLLKQKVEELERQHPGGMVILVSMAGLKYIYVSDTVHDLLGYKPSHFVGQRVSRFAVDEYEPHLRITMQDALLTGESIEVNIRFKTKSGMVQPVHAMIRRVIDPETNEVYLLSWVEAADR